MFEYNILTNGILLPVATKLKSGEFILLNSLLLLLDDNIEVITRDTSIIKVYDLKLIFSEQKFKSSSPLNILREDEITNEYE